MLASVMLSSVLFSATLAYSGPAPAELESRVQEIFDESCTMCHDDSDDLDLSGSPGKIVGVQSSQVDKMLVKPGDPANSYLLDKMYGAEGIEGELMPMGMDALPPEELEAVSSWIASLPSEDGAGAEAEGAAEVPERKPPERKQPQAFHGTHQVVLPTTTTLGKRTLQFRVDHRFGLVGTERGFAGLDAGAIMSIGLAYGILDGWDIRLRRTNSRKAWELATKYVPVRQEDGMPLSFGLYGSVDFLRDFDVANRWSGNFMGMLSRLWFERWATMLTLSYHIPTNHNSQVLIDFGDGEGPVPVKDTRGTFNIGVASTVYLGKKKRWGIDMEWFLPIPDGSDPNVFYYRGGDADPGGTKIGAWSLGASYFTGKHFFQVFFTNNREIHPNLAAPGGQTKNPFETVGDGKIPFNFFLGFNLGRRWSL